MSNSTSVLTLRNTGLMLISKRRELSINPSFVADMMTKEAKRSSEIRRGRLILDCTFYRHIQSSLLCKQKKCSFACLRVSPIKLLRLLGTPSYVLRSLRRTSLGHASGAVLEVSSLLVSAGLCDRWYSRAFSAQSFSPASTLE